MACSTADSVKPSVTSSKASSKSSKRTAKLRELQTKALEERQTLEKKQLEERLALEREMLEVSDSEAESFTSLEKINEWLEKTENVGNPVDETPLPMYDEFQPRPAVLSTQPHIPSSCAPVVHSNIRQSVGNSVPLQPCVSQQFGGSYAPGSRFVDHSRPSGNIPGVVASYQPSSAVSSLPSVPVYTVASQQPIMTTAYSATNYPHLVARNPW